jgi:hypothetical protein
MFILTKGDDKVQRDKITLNKLEELFGWSNIHIVDRKGEAEMREVLAAHHLNPNETIMIGDSLKDDIGSALKCGMDCMHIELGGIEWDYNKTTDRPTYKATTVLSLPLYVELSEQDHIDALEKHQQLPNYGDYKGTGSFTDDELTYAAYARCLCGEGMAYPKKGAPNGYWDCSAILKGTARQDIKHEVKLPFAFWSVKSENQPSAGGATTRPK